MQLNVNAYKILISCFVLWTKCFYAELPFRVFQNLYWMKTAICLLSPITSKVTRKPLLPAVRTMRRTTSTCSFMHQGDGYLASWTTIRCHPGSMSSLLSKWAMCRLWNHTQSPSTCGGSRSSGRRWNLNRTRIGYSQTRIWLSIIGSVRLLYLVTLMNGRARGGPRR